MPENLTARALYDALRDKLKLQWTAGTAGENRLIFLRRHDKTAGQPASGLARVGFLNFIRQNQIQVIGEAELAYLAALDPAAYQSTLERLFAAEPACVMVVDGFVAPPLLVAESERHKVPLFHTALGGTAIVEYVRYFLATCGAEHQTLHGVFMEVMGIGVLLSGPAGIGKSELALELITRGHRLIADDAPDFAKLAPDTISGSCPKPLQDFLEVRGLGILDVRAMFGGNAIKQMEILRLIIQLTPMIQSEMSKIDRLQGNTRMRSILEVEVPEITLPVIIGSNLAVLVEGAVRNHLLLLKGYDASAAFIERQRRIMDQGEV